MDTKKQLTILLSYVSYPVTTAAYFERALRKHHNVITVGPKLPDFVVEKWNLENMKLPITDLNVPTDFAPDMCMYVNEINKQVDADMFLWVESVPGFNPLNISGIEIPTACYLIDSHINLENHLIRAKDFDHVFIAQREYVPEFKKAGIESIHWLPLGCDTEIHANFSKEKKHDIGFVGSFVGNERRQKLVKRISEEFNFYYERCFWTDMSKVFSDSKIVFNNAVENDLNMRVFEVMSTGSFILTDDPKNSGQDELLVDGEELAIYEDENINQICKFYLENDELRETIARRGNEVIQNAHKYEDRLVELLKVVLGDKTSTPNASEWKERSLKNLTVTKEEIYKLKRSFVIPVLDYSPASEFNIKTLLKDLENIEGNVIVIFNSIEVAEEMKDHPRIDYYAIMKHNIGVAPAWNVGINMSRTPITYVLNSDLHLEREAIQKMDDALIKLPDVAIVGPQGSFVNFEQQNDYMYFDQGSFSEPVEVDAVSGFLFGVKTIHFTDGILNFENRYAPCYFEEWDLGYKIKLAGLKSYVVPVTEYTHHWSGSIRSLKTVKYFDKESTIEEIHSRNGVLFDSLWREKTKKLNREDILRSLWFQYAEKLAEKLLHDNEVETAEQVYLRLLETDPQNKMAFTNLGVIEASKGNIENARKFFREALKIDPNFEIAKDNLEAVRL
ncbi:MAG: glycosyltransferase [Melioribacteraceae bacterium]|nr:glycosyltransferase [Melioribacteraceae bacterium]